MNLATLLSPLCQMFTHTQNLKQNKIHGEILWKNVDTSMIKLVSSQFSMLYTEPDQAVLFHNFVSFLLSLKPKTLKCAKDPSPSGPYPSLDITGCSRHTAFFHSIKFDYLRPLLLLFMSRSPDLAIITFQISAQTSHPQGWLTWLPSEEMKTHSYTFPLSPVISSFITDHTCTSLFIVCLYC